MHPALATSRPYSRRQVIVGAAAVLVGVAAALRSDEEPVLEPDLVTRCRFGAYTRNEPWPVDPHFELEAELGGTTLPVASWFQEWGGHWPGVAADTLALRGGYDILMCWEAHGVSFADILSGAWDAQIEEYVAAASTYPGNVVLRPFHESNGQWYDWAPSSGRGFVTDAEQWVRAWRHVVRVARGTGTTNVSFLWCMNTRDVGSIAMEDLWPGEDFVDLVGLDGYNRGGSALFTQVLEHGYERVTRLDRNHDFWVGETGISAGNPVHSSFYRSAYTTKAFPRMTTVCWFDTESDGEDWSLTVHPEDVEVHRTHLPRAPQYGGRRPRPAPPPPA